MRGDSTFAVGAGFLVVCGVVVVAGALGLTNAFARAQDAPASAAPPPSAATRPAATTAATTTPTTAPATTTASTRRASDDPLATPESAVLQLFKRMRENDVADVRQMLIDPPPTEQLKEQVAMVSWKLNKGAKFELVETSVQNSAAVVLYRTIYPKGRAEVTPVLLVERYGRWKVLLSAVNPKRYTPAEKEDMVVVTKWAQERLAAMNAATAATTQPAQ